MMGMPVLRVVFPRHLSGSLYERNVTMRQDNHGTALTNTLRDSPEPMTASELRDAVGCSRQRVYTWLQANTPHLREVGKDAHGGQRYVWIEAGTPRAVTVDYQGPTGATDDGMTMRVSTVMVEQGEMVLVLIGPDGSVYHARPA
jgi:hypothetical protein